MNVWRHVRAVALLPFVVTVVVPGLLVWRHGFDLAAWWLVLLGAVLVVL